MARAEPMPIDEFTDTSSDDVIYLWEGRTALLTHPLRAENPELCNASFCRLYAIVMIGSIEAMLDRWRTRDNLNILDAYFAQGVTNGDRVKSLRAAFVNNGINVKNDVFDDYLAIKYLRNAIVHASWETQSGQLKQDQVDWIAARNFPTDTRKLNEEHWQKIEWVNENMMFYIALTGIPNIKPRPDLKDVGMSVRPLPDTTGIIALAESPRLYWSNLSRISAVIGKQIQAAALTPDHYWGLGLTEEQIQAMPHNDRKRRFFMAAKAAAGGFEPLISLSGHAENAASCWSQYTRLVPEFNDLTAITLQGIVETFRVIHDKKIFPKNGMFPEWKDDIPEDIRHQLIMHSFESIEPLSVDQIAAAHQVGANAKRAIPNIMPLSLFSIQLPILAPTRAQEWAETASYIADEFEAGQSWYSFVECQPSPRDTIDFYREMSRMMSVEAKNAS
jgi:hypothetical protein